MKKAIIGAGGFGREVYQSLPVREQIITSFFVNDEFWRENNDNILPLSKLDIVEYEVIVAVGNPSDRKKIVESLPKNAKFFTHIHESVLIMDKNIQIGEGSFIGAYSILTTNITIGKHAILNRGNQIGHDCEIGNYFSAMAGVVVSGNVKIGNNVYMGNNSSIREKITICNNVIIGLNGGVVKNINEEGVYGGVPVKKIN
jgi:sugar O-acyltransferase (sialic acid O-acetyltransferase NeuD family)